MALRLGTFRIAVLRLITTIIYASEMHPQTVSDVDILNLLPITQDGCQAMKTEKERERGVGQKAGLLTF